MSLKDTSRPQWLTFDCYGTLIQWDEGLLAAVREILGKRQATEVDASRFIEVYDRYEHELEQQSPTAPSVRFPARAFDLRWRNSGLPGAKATPQC